MFKFIQRIFAPKTATLCGHKVPHAKGTVHAFGESCDVGMPHNSQGRFDFCFACISAMSVRCPWCEHTIFIGDPITLYSPHDPYVWLSKESALYRLDCLQMVGCGRPDCAESGADYCGYWEPIPEKVDGRFVAGVRRFPSALERAMSSGEMVIVGDLLDRAETRPSRVVTLPEYLPPLVA